MLGFDISGNTNKLERFLDSIPHRDLYSSLDRYAQLGVDELSRVTPRESGITAQSWSYEIEREGDVVTIWWINSHVVNGFNVAIGLQYGHGTGTGGWVEGYDYINPAIRSTFDELAAAIWKEVQSA